MLSHIPFIQLLSDLRSRGRDPGDSLGRIVLTSDEWRCLCTAVQYGLDHGLSSFQHADRKRWGTALLLVGAQALRTKIKDIPFTYEKIWRETGLRARLPFGAAEYDAMEEGAEVWGIGIIRSTLANGRRQRRFLGTMVRHSGAGWALLVELATLVARQKRWEWIAGTNIDSIADWIDACARRALGEQVKNNLDDETREALAARLQDVAAVRALLGELTDPDNALKEFGADDLTAALDAPDEGATRLMLELLCRSPEDVTAGTPRWLWHLDGEGYERAVIEIPEKIRLPDDLPAEVDQIRLQLLDDTLARGCLYVRDAPDVSDRKHRVFKHREGRRVRIPRSLHAHLVAQYRDGLGTRELIVAELSVPTAPVAVFDADRGRLHSHPRPGTRVALIAEPGWRLHPPEGFIRGGKGPLEAWTGTMPGHILTCRLSAPDGESQQWTISATPAPLQLTLTNAIAGLRLAQAPVVCGIPEFRCNIMRGRGTCTVHGEGTLDTFQVVIRGGRLKFSSAKQSFTNWPTGVLSLALDVNGYKCTERVAVLPADTEVEVVSDQEGTLATLRHRAFRAKLHARDTTLPAEGGEDNLCLPPRVHGRVVVDYTLALASTTWSGVWRIFAHPPATEVVDRDGVVREGEDDFSALRSGGSLRIYGEPRSTVELEIEDECWSLRLSPDGERLFRFVEIPSEIFNREAAQKQAERLRVNIRWPSGERHTQTFVIPENEKLVAKIVPGDAGAPPCVRVAWSRSVPGEVRLEAVRAWQPWAPTISLPARSATWPDWYGKSGFEADFPLPTGSYQISLFSGERRISGATLVPGPDDTLPPPPSYWPPLESELWLKPDVRRLAPLVRQWSEEGEDEALLPGLLRNVTRFGIKWFWIAQVLPEITGSWRLETLLRTDKPEELDRLVEDYYEQTGLAWMFVRERDLACVAARLSAHGPGAANTLLVRVAELDAGLLRAAARVWKSRLSTTGSHLNTAIMLQGQLNTYQFPRQRNAEEHQQIATLEPELDLNKVCVPRLLGLRQLHQHSAPLSDMLGKLHTLTNGRFSSPSRLDPAWFQKLPERLQEQERAIATWAWFVHRWRRGETMTLALMRGLSHVVPLAHKSFDYWLNSWDLLDPP